MPLGTALFSVQVLLLPFNSLSAAVFIINVIMGVAVSLFLLGFSYAVECGV